VCLMLISAMMIAASCSTLNVNDTPTTKPPTATATTTPESSPVVLSAPPPAGDAPSPTPSETTTPPEDPVIPVSLGDSPAYASEVLGPVWTTILGSEGIYNIYGTYSDLTIVYFVNDAAEYIYSSATAHISGTVSVLRDSKNSNKVYAGFAGTAPLDGTDATEQLIICLTNMFRAENSLMPLLLNDQLATAAREHSEDMQTRKYFDHVTPSGLGIAERIAAKGYISELYGENIIYNYGNAFNSFNAWVQDATYRATLLGDYQEIGAGWSSNGKYGTAIMASPV